MSNNWGADVPISMPEPPATMPLVPMEGMAFTIDGICHPVTEEQVIEMATPTYGPEGSGDG